MNPGEEKKRPGRRSSPGLVLKRLEGKLQSALHHAGRNVAGGSNHAEVAPFGGVAVVAGGVAEGGMVESVEGLPTELQLDVFDQNPALHDRCIVAKVMRAAP